MKFKPNQEFYYLGAYLKLIYCWNLGDAASISRNGRIWLVNVDYPTGKTVYHKLSEGYLESILNKPKKVTDHNWSNRHSVQFR